MEQSILQEANDRIKRLELYFDILQKAFAHDPAAIRNYASYKELLRILIRYYEGGQWLRDYELDEKGLLPPSLKRGVLAQDALYDFLDRLSAYATDNGSF